MLPTSLLDDIAAGRPVDWDRATREARRMRDPFVRAAMASDAATTQELPAISSAELMADLDARNRVARDLDARLQGHSDIVHAAHVGELAEMARLAIRESERTARAMDAMEGGR
jgi:hypothetical protein